MRTWRFARGEELCVLRGLVFDSVLKKRPFHPRKGDARSNTLAAAGFLLLKATSPHHRHRVSARIAPPADLARVLTLAPAFRIEAPDNDVDTYVFRSRGKRRLAPHRRVPGGNAGPVTIHLNGWRARDIATGRIHDGAARVSATHDAITLVFLEIGR